MEFETTNRGFKRFPPLETRYGHEIQVYESSAAMEPCLWLKVELDHELGGIQPEAATAQLTVDQAEELIARLRACIDNHYQLQP